MSEIYSMSRRDIIAAGAVGAAGIIAAAPQANEAKGADNGFVWGVASASAQTESRQGRGRSNWDVFADTPGKIADGSSNALTTEFETRFPEDLDLLKTAGVPAFRLSLAWPRVQPDGPGKPSQTGLDTYARIFDAMQTRGIEPWPTMFHWDVPVWAGNFRSRDIAARMADYADILVTRFGDRIKQWIILNEPNTASLLGYGFGRHAPGFASQEAMLASVHHQNLALGLMTQAARARASQGTPIGTTHNVAPIRSPSQEPADLKAAAFADTLWNWAFLDPLFGRGYPAILEPLLAPLVQDGDLATIAAGKPDFLGVNNYSDIYIKADGVGIQQADWPVDVERTDYFPVQPAVFESVLTGLCDRYGNIPLYVTETGFAIDKAAPWETRINDERRSRYLDSYLSAAASAKTKGVDLRGLFYWSATDNWEWSEGYTKRFGLIAVDPKTQRRGAKRSLAKFGEQVRRHFPDAVTSKPKI